MEQFTNKESTMPESSGAMLTLREHGRRERQKTCPGKREHGTRLFLPGLVESRAMRLPRIQFTIRGILWATFWMAVCFASWISFEPLANAPGSPRIVGYGLMFFIFGGPFLALGALFGRLWIGAILAVAAFCSFIGYLAFTFSSLH
jgi:hypothetical protein